MNLKRLKYFFALIWPLIGTISLAMHGIYCWMFPIYSFLLVPIFELFVSGSAANLSAEEEDRLKESRFYDYLLYLTVPIQYCSLFLFLFSFREPMPHYEISGKIITMGLLCGILGINAAHELGHRVKPFEQFLAKSLLLTSLYMHFIIEHNRGHHKHVSTPDDPATSHLNQTLYAFWYRSIVYSFVSAWKIETSLLKKKGVSVFSFHNEMIRFILTELSLVILILFVFGPLVMFHFITAALIGILLLETINYIQHYGLSRKKTNANMYERVMPIHSWNSNHPMGRLMLFELGRHSDHHYMASRKYQVLRSYEQAPQMPTGYPGMMLLSLVPPLWFKAMNHRVNQRTD